MSILKLTPSCKDYLWGGSPPLSKAACHGGHAAVTALVAMRPALRQQGGDLVLIQLMHQRVPPLRFGVKDV